MDHTTYQVGKPAHLFEHETQAGLAALMDLAAKSMVSNPRFNRMSKQLSDTVIGGSRGRFIQMDNYLRAKPTHIFTFITFQNTNMYSVQCTCFKSFDDCWKESQYFFGHTVFGIRPTPINK